MLKEIFVQVVFIAWVFSAPELNVRQGYQTDSPIPDISPDMEDGSSEDDWDQLLLNSFDERSHEYWQKTGQNILQKNLDKKMNKNVAKNLIILVADGMSIPTQMATRMYMDGEEKVLSFEEFPYVGLSKTYCVDSQVPDSSCTATAFLSGIKTNSGVLSMNGFVSKGNCTENTSNHVDSIFKFAQDAGKATGIVTNTRVTHATPAAAYAKSASNDWENDSKTPDGCQDIAMQLIHGHIGRNFDVILGGGFREFIPNNRNDYHGNPGKRGDSKDLIRDWKLKNRRSTFVFDKASLRAHKSRYGDKLLGLFSESHMQYHLFNDKTDEPSLLEMTQKALQMVSENPNGYVLMIESGRIDHAHHETRAQLALAETRHLHQVVDFIKSEVNESETLILVTADHSHTMTVSGYPKRRNDILSFGGFLPQDVMPYFTLSYANGMGFHKHYNESGRINPIDMNFTDPNFQQPTTIPLKEETHGGDDVGVYALGPYSHLFTGVFEQHYIAHAMMYATCLGPESFMKAPACSAASYSTTSMTIMIFIPLTGIFAMIVLRQAQ